MPNGPQALLVLLRVSILWVTGEFGIYRRSLIAASSIQNHTSVTAELIFNQMEYMSNALPQILIECSVIVCILYGMSDPDLKTNKQLNKKTIESQINKWLQSS